MDDVTSNRAEGYVILSMSHLLTAITKFYGIQQATATLYCDNNEALRYRSLTQSTYTTMTKRDADLKMEMETILSNSPVTLVFKEVNGHADDEGDFVYDEASQEVKRNIDMDPKAKKISL